MRKESSGEFKTHMTKAFHF